MENPSFKNKSSVLLFLRDQNDCLIKTPETVEGLVSIEESNRGPLERWSF